MHTHAQARFHPAYVHKCMQAKDTEATDLGRQLSRVTQLKDEMEVQLRQAHSSLQEANSMLQVRATREVLSWRWVLRGRCRTEGQVVASSGLLRCSIKCSDAESSGAGCTCRCNCRP